MERIEKEGASINGIFAELGLAVSNTPEIFGDKLREVQIALEDWEAALEEDSGEETNKVEQRLRDLHKILEVKSS